MAFYDNLVLEKGMYGTMGKTFTQVLEEMDSSHNYKGTELEGLDAYQRQLKRFNIHVGGADSDMVEKFFQSGSSSALFPEYVARAVRKGMEKRSKLPQMTAAVTRIDALDYRTITADSDLSKMNGSIVEECGQLPQTVIKTQKSLVQLHKRGRMLVSSYEALRFQKLDLFTVTLQQIGACIAEEQMKDAVNVLINGDGNNNAAKVTKLSKAITYSDIVDLWGACAPYELSTLIAGTKAVKDLMNLSEFKDASAGFNFKGTGKTGTPLGAQLLHVASVPEGTILGVDKSCALEMVQAGDILTDYDRLIDRQMERASISCITGFAKIFGAAAQTLTYTAGA